VDTAAEDSLEDLELKRKAETKRLQMEKLEGWGVGTSMEDEVDDGETIQLTIQHNFSNF
jgi:hypothetical protein